MGIVFCDLDEVISDFTGAALRVHGWKREQLEKVREPGHWDINNPMGLTLMEFWEPINKQGMEFWRDLELLPWAGKLISLLDELTEDTWRIITTPTLSLHSYMGKRHWINDNLPAMMRRSYIGGDKWLFANSNSVLIDDSEENVLAFQDHGGHGLLFPSPGNSLHEYSDDPVGYIKDALEELDAFQL